MPTETNKPTFTEKQAAVIILANSTLNRGVAESVVAALRIAGFAFAPEPRTPGEEFSEGLMAAWPQNVFNSQKHTENFISDVATRANRFRNAALDEAIKIVFAEPINGDRIVQKIEALKTK